MKANMRLGGVAIFAAAMAVVGLGVGCGGSQQVDPTLNITGTESEPLVVASEDGGTTLGCPAEKALICHVPPGNPANMHTICVGIPAEPAHLKHHPDYLGVCGDPDGGFSPRGHGHGDGGWIDEGGSHRGDDGDVEDDAGEVDDDDGEGEVVDAGGTETEVDAGSGDTQTDVDAGTPTDVDAGNIN